MPTYLHVGRSFGERGKGIAPFRPKVPCADRLSSRSEAPKGTPKNRVPFRDRLTAELWLINHKARQNRFSQRSP